MSELLTRQQMNQLAQLIGSEVGKYVSTKAPGDTSSGRGRAAKATAVYPNIDTKLANASIHQLSKQIGIIAGEMKDMSKSSIAASNGISDVYKASSMLSKALMNHADVSNRAQDKLRAALTKAVMSHSKLAAQMLDGVDSMRTLVDKIDDSSAALRKYHDVVDDLADTEKDGIGIRERANKIMKAVAGSALVMGKTFEELTEQYETEGDALISKIEDNAKAHTKMQRELISTTRNFALTTSMVKRLGETVKGIDKILDNRLSQAIVTMTSFTMSTRALMGGIGGLYEDMRNSISSGITSDIITMTKQATHMGLNAGEFVDLMKSHMTQLASIGGVSQFAANINRYRESLISLGADSKMAPKAVAEFTSALMTAGYDIKDSRQMDSMMQSLMNGWTTARVMTGESADQFAKTTLDMMQAGKGLDNLTYMTRRHRNATLESITSIRAELAQRGVSVDAQKEYVKTLQDMMGQSVDDYQKTRTSLYQSGAVLGIDTKTLQSVDRELMKGEFGDMRVIESGMKVIESRMQSYLANNANASPEVMLGIRNLLDKTGTRTLVKPFAEARRQAEAANVTQADVDNRIIEAATTSAYRTIENSIKPLMTMLQSPLSQIVLGVAGIAISTMLAGRMISGGIGKTNGHLLDIRRLLERRMFPTNDDFGSNGGKKGGKYGTASPTNGGVRGMGAGGLPTGGFPTPTAGNGKYGGWSNRLPPTTLRNHPTHARPDGRIHARLGRAPMYPVTMPKSKWGRIVGAAKAVGGYAVDAYNGSKAFVKNKAAAVRNGAVGMAVSARNTTARAAITADMATGGRLSGSARAAGRIGGRVGGLAASGAGMIGKGALRAIPFIGQIATIGLVGKALFDGYESAAAVFETTSATTGQKISAAMGAGLETLTFGLLSGDTIARGIYDTSTLVAEKLGVTGMSAGDAFVKTITSVGSFIKTGWETMFNSIIPAVYGGVKYVLRGLITTIGSALSPSTWKGAFTSKNGGKSLAETIISGIGYGIKFMLEGIVKGISTVLLDGLDMIVDPLSSVLPDSIMKNLKNGMKRLRSYASSDTKYGSGVPTPSVPSSGTAVKTFPALPGIDPKFLVNAKSTDLQAMSKVKFTDAQRSAIMAGAGGNSEIAAQMEALLRVENRGRDSVSNTAVSNKGAKGAYQITPIAFADTMQLFPQLKGKFKYDDMTDFAKASEFAGYMIKGMQIRAKTTDPLAIAAYYNGGFRGSQSVLSGGVGMENSPENKHYVSAYAQWIATHNSMNSPILRNGATSPNAVPVSAVVNRSSRGSSSATPVNTPVVVKPPVPVPVVATAPVVPGGDPMSGQPTPAAGSPRTYQPTGSPVVSGDEVTKRLDSMIGLLSQLVAYRSVDARNETVRRLNSSDNGAFTGAGAMHGAQ